jgi:hypothetical protein
MGLFEVQLNFTLKEVMDQFIDKNIRGLLQKR